MRRRFQLSLFSQILVAGLAGGVLGGLLRILPPGPFTALQPAIDLAASVFLVGAKAVAVPMIVSSMVLGAVGLEPMRALGKIAAKTVLWMVLSSMAAVSIGAGAAFVFPVEPSVEMNANFLAAGEWWRHSVSLPRAASTEWSAWTGLVLVSLGFAYYRNQIEEGHARMLSRWFQGVDETLKALAGFVVRLTPLGALIWMTFAVSSRDPLGTWYDDGLLVYKLKTLLLAWAVYGTVALPGAMWIFARLNAWKCLGAMLPAVLTALVSGSPEATFPVTLHTVRERAHVSNRVAGVVLSLGTAFQREGLALGCAALGVCNWRAHHASLNWSESVGLLLTCALLGCGAGVMRSGGGLVLLLTSQLGADATGLLTGWGIGRFVTMGGAALSVWSNACAAAVIARGEGEYWVPGPPPTPDELQGLKNDLELAES